ncbi:hypothetical protein F4809DRAFT_636999 [Biscogniauxia mediterranea]|nr:hypothetical protein F4809DRAFT_636999 [Biscogniauxia mediterranea]
MPSMQSFTASKGTRQNPIMIDDCDSSASQSHVPQRSGVIMRGYSARQDLRKAQPKMPNFGNESDFDPYDPVAARELDSMKEYDERIRQSRLAEKRLAGTSSSRISSRNSGMAPRAPDEERGGESELLFHDAETARSLDFRKEIETGHYHRQGVDSISARNPSPKNNFGNARLSTSMSSGTRVEEPELEFHDAETARRLDYRKVLEDRSYRGSGIDESSAYPTSSAMAPKVDIRSAEPAKPVEAERRFTPPKYGPASHLFARPSDSKWDDEEDAEKKDGEKSTHIISRPVPPPIMGSNKRPRVFDEDMEENPFACLDEMDDSDASDEFDYGGRSHPKRRRRAFNSSRY